MRLLRVIGSMDPAKGGPGQGIRNSVPEMEKRGIDNEVVCLDDPSAPFLKKDPFTVHALGPGKTSWNYSPKLVPWLYENLHRFDVVIIHGLWLYPGYAVSNTIRLLNNRQRALKKIAVKIPRIYVMPHGMLDPYFQRISERKSKVVRNWVYWKLIERRVVNEASGVLFTCKGELELARVPFRPYNPKQEINVGYGIAEPPCYLPQMHHSFLKKCSELKDAPYLLFLSRIHEKKGIDLLIKAYWAILEEMTQENDRDQNVKLGQRTSGSGGTLTHQLPKLVIAGPGLETSFGQKIQRLVSGQEKLRQAVFFPGMLTGNTKWGAFFGCEAFILPSHQENFGIAVVEALACRKPVLITKQVNIWQEIVDAGGGIVSDDTLEGVKDMLRYFIAMSPEEKRAIGQRARKAFENHFVISTAVKQFITAVGG